MNNKILSLTLSLAFMMPYFSFAQDAVKPNAQKKDVMMEKKEEVKTMRQEAVKTLRTDVAEKRTMLKNEAMEKRDALNTEVMQKRETLKMEAKTLPKEQLMEKREAVRVEIKEKREDFRETVKEKRETFKEEAKERVEALKQKVSEEKAKRIEAFFGTMVRKFEAAISRLRMLADRIDSRLDKFEDEGKDVSSLRISLDSARAVIEDTENALDMAKEEFNALVQNEAPQEYFSKVKEVIAGVSQKVRDAHKALVDVINSTKGASQ